jgi:hypothetical protein
MRKTEFRSIELPDLFRYYYFWNDFEKKYIENKNNGNVDIDLFYDYTKYMGITRNFKSGKIENVLNIADDYIKNTNQPSVDKLSDILCSNNLTHAGVKRVVVAASKILWFFDKNTIIMDNNNKNVLNKLPLRINNYQSYCDAWLNLFKIKQIEIKNKIVEYEIFRIDEIFESEWFQMRIFDTYLWKLFNEKANAT